MKADTEKALLEWAAAQAAEREAHLQAQGYVEVVSPVTQRATKAARSYLATLERKPDPDICTECGQPWASHHLGDHPPKPGPRRGVEAILNELKEETLMHAAHIGQCDWAAKRTVEALRLYREERERVEKVVEDMNAEASEGIWAAADWRGHVMEWADELERRGAD